MRISNLLNVETIGTLAVVLSLIFVGVEIRDGNREARAATVQATLSSELEMATMFTDNIAVWDKVVRGGALADGEESRMGVILFNQLMTTSENWLLQYNAGYLDAQMWESRLTILPLVIQLPIYEDWKTSIGSQSHSGEFLELLDELSRSGEVE